MDENRKAMAMASFSGDSLALGAHWIYDTERISKTYGRIDSFLKPPVNSYHPTKGKGEFTHYGDQALVLLESVAAMNGFDLSDFSVRWRALFENYKGYIDQATRATLSRYAAGGTPGNSGSPSDDLAGASRIFPLVYVYHDDLDKLVEASRSQTRMTHNNVITVDSAEFFSTVSWFVLDGMTPVEAIKRVSRARFEASPISVWVDAGLNSKDTESVASITGFGQSCHIQEAFPGVIHLISRYEKHLKEALVQSVMAGGDSAARGIMVGMVLGAHLGKDSLPDEWGSGLIKREEIVALLEKIT